MPKKLIVNVQTGEVQELELAGDELAAYEASLIVQANTPASPPELSLAEIVAQLQAEIVELKTRGTTP
jgi:hypothetical protein